MTPFRQAAVVMAAAISAAGQTPSATLTLSDCIKLALSAPSSVTAARQQSEIASYAVAQARAGFLPQTSLSNNFTYNSPNKGDFSFVALNGVHEYSTLGTIGVDADTSGRLRAQLVGPGAQADRRFVAECGMDPVHDQRLDRLVMFGETLREVARLVNRVAARRRHEYERG